MTRLLIIAISLLVSFSCSQQPAPSAKGHLLIIGGGKRPAAIMQKFTDLAGGSEARIAIIPTASSYYKESGQRYQDEFLGYGAAKARAFNILSQDIANSDSMVKALQGFDAFFFGGGNQNRLTEFMLGTKSLDVIKEAYNNGATIGGTSAGAAVMSATMITGNGNWEILQRDSVITAPGFGFVQSTVIDQHFFARKRINRLLAVCVQSGLDGIGVDESTAIWVKPDGSKEVIGESIVIALNMANATRPQKNDSLLTGQNILMDIYKHGDRF